jgi:hypothetical protein
MSSTTTCPRCGNDTLESPEFACCGYCRAEVSWGCLDGIARLSEEDIEWVLAHAFDTPLPAFAERDLDLPCAERLACGFCRREVTLPLTGSGPEVSREWVCPACDPRWDDDPERLWRG